MPFDSIATVLRLHDSKKFARYRSDRGSATYGQ